MNDAREQAPVLDGISQIRGFFRTNDQPIYFVSPTAFNLLGIDRSVRSFHYVNWFDSFDGTHPRVFVPEDRPAHDFQSMEDVCNALIAHPEVRTWSARHGSRRPKVCMVMFDEETERLVQEAGMELILPPCALRKHIDSKIVTTRIGNEAGVPSAPNTLGRAGSYAELSALAERDLLGRDLVVQTPYGDSGKTTFFIKEEADWDRHAEHLIGEDLKVMRRINCQAAAMEAVITRHGTVVGPVMRDLTGHPELTPYRGGWCGNDMFPGAMSSTHRDAARAATARLGDRLATEGYRGFFEVDYLVDRDTGDLYLGELNPRISGVTSITNVTAAAYADLPLFAFHLLEFMGVDYTLDVDEINERWGRVELLDVWTQAVIKECDDRTELITAAPQTGIWRMDEDGNVEWGRWGNDWHSIQDESEAFYLRVAGPGDYRYKGGDLGILVSRGRFESDDGTLSERARRWIDGIQRHYAGTPVGPAADVAPMSLPLVKGF
ncbi:MAG: biotin carboxylase [Solirubrobacteraceae bacterium]|jgi:biotin carboxylase